MKCKDKGSIKSVKRSSGKGTVKKNEREVEFSFFAPEAHEVYLAGDFNHWGFESMPMRRGMDGNWSVQTSLPPGRYEYKFLVDHRWVEDSSAAELAANSFGTLNLVLRVE